MLLNDFTECNLCQAMILRDHLSRHIGWHERLTTRLARLERAILAPYDCCQLTTPHEHATS